MTTVKPSVGDRYGYALLQFEDRQYYMKSYEVSLGRHSSEAKSADVDLGEQPTVSKRHAVIRYNTEHAHFELEVLGKNGAYVGGELVAQGSAAPLRSRDLVQVGGVTFYFLLPVRHERAVGAPVPPGAADVTQGKTAVAKTAAQAAAAAAAAAAT